MIWQDVVFMLGGFIFAPALVVAIIKGTKFPTLTSLPTAIVLTAYCATYVTMGFWLAFISTALTALCWFVLFFRRKQ